jgi:cell division transport system ATP-binding protein
MIEATHLSKTYSRGVYALRNLSLRVDKGEFVFLTGPSGAGKQQTFGFLVGQVMKATHGKANPGLVNTLLKRHLDG